MLQAAWRSRFMIFTEGQLFLIKDSIKKQIVYVYHKQDITQLLDIADIADALQFTELQVELSE